MADFCFGMTGFLESRIFRGLLFFLLLAALAMVSAGPASVLLPALLPEAALILPCVSECSADFLAAALTIRKNE